MTVHELISYFAGAEEIPIKIYDVKDWMIHNAQLVDHVFVIESDIDKNILYGMYTHKIESSESLGENQRICEIYWARELNYCWKRFVLCKELMHLFDGDEARVSNIDTAETLIFDLTSPFNPERQYSQVWTADQFAVLKALLVLTPEHAITQLRAEYRSGELTEYEVALKLRIPEYFVKHILDEEFRRMIVDLLK